MKHWLTFIFLLFAVSALAHAPAPSVSSLDLSGGLAGAGGIGGLLARTDAEGSTFYHHDGAGNVTGLMDAQGNMAARYLYGPFGKVLGQWGPLAEANRYQFSSKETEALSGLSYYGYRFYDPGLQRWLNPDPLGEAGGLNLYQSFFNNPLLFVDRNGLDNIYNMGAGNNAVPDLMVSMDLGGSGLAAGYQEGTDPLFMIGGLAGLDPSQIVQLPGLLHGLITLADDGTTKSDKIQASVSLAMWLLTKGKRCKPVKSTPPRVFQVTPQAVALPPGPKYQIPSHYVQNPHRQGNYGVIENGKYVEKLRIDPATPPGMKGPEHSHYHLDGDKTHNSPRPGDPDPGFN